jgi:hypothetical protein
MEYYAHGPSATILADLTAAAGPTDDVMVRACVCMARCRVRVCAWHAAVWVLVYGTLPCAHAHTRSPAPHGLL